MATAEARASLPEQIPLGDAVFSVGRAALLGAGLASGSEEAFAAALNDRLHEPYRAENAPLLGEVRDDLPAGALGATISGSGPTVIVWATRTAKECSVELSNRFPDVEVLWLSTSAKELSSPHEPDPYDRPSDPAKRQSAALTDGPARAGARPRVLKGTGFTTTTSPGR